MHQPWFAAGVPPPACFNIWWGITAQHAGVARAQLAAQVAGEDPSPAFGAGGGSLSTALLIDGGAIQGLLRAGIEADAAPGRAGLVGCQGVGLQFRRHEHRAQPEHIAIGLVDEQGVPAHLSQAREDGRVLEGEDAPPVPPLRFPVLIGLGAGDGQRERSLLLQHGGKPAGDGIQLLHQLVAHQGIGRMGPRQQRAQWETAGHNDDRPAIGPDIAGMKARGRLLEPGDRRDTAEAGPQLRGA